MAMGFDSLSMNATNLPKVKWMLRQVNMGKAKELLVEALSRQPAGYPQLVAAGAENLGLARMIGPGANKTL